MHAVLIAIFVALCVGTIIRVAAYQLGSDQDKARDRLHSLAVWWVLAIILGGCLLVGGQAVFLLFAAMGIVGFWEFTRLIDPTCAKRSWFSNFDFWMGACLIVSYYIVLWKGWSALPTAWLPVAAVALFACKHVMLGNVAGFIRRVSGMTFGVVLLGLCLSHGAMLSERPESTSGALTSGELSPALVLYLIVLTQLNDISQALVGKQIGKRKITPTVSPGKTWEGFLGGVFVTTVCAVGLSPWLTTFWEDASIPVAVTWGASAGLMIAVTGFAGDITMSAMKRDASVKDSGAMLPGHGGVLDRIDSLIFTSPALAYFLIFRRLLLES